MGGLGMAEPRPILGVVARAPVGDSGWLSHPKVPRVAKYP